MMKKAALKINEDLQQRFTTRTFYMQHMAPYAYVKKLSSGKVVLDAGTASGYGAFYLAETAKSVVGIDIDPLQIKKAQDCYNRTNLSYSVSDILNIQYPDEYFDMVISSQVVEHIQLDKLDTYLSEIFRVLKDDGAFFINTLNFLNNLKGRNLDEYDKCTQHVKEFKPEEFRDFLKQRFPDVRVLGLRRNFVHNLCHLFKKSGLFRNLPDKINPLQNFYKNKITTEDFVYSFSRLEKSIDLFGICRKNRAG